jgi:hypothetical protein
MVNNPQKLSDFTKNKLLPDEAKKYLHNIVETEMPTGLKRYLELELFPCIQMKVSMGISLQTARRWLHKEGFKYMAHKKGLYFDGHECDNIIEYRQNIFLPLMQEYAKQLVFFEVGNVGKEGKLNLPQDLSKLVLLAHDEMTAQSNDGEKMSWVLDGEQPLKKKGVRRGLYQSDVIYSTKGWLWEASQTLEYGKNYDGYWNGELFVKQVCDLITQFPMAILIWWLGLIFHSLLRGSYLPLNMLTVHHIKHLLWWIIHKAIQLIQLMHFSDPE